jgi:hypothetical protein
MCLYAKNNVLCDETKVGKFEKIKKTYNRCNIMQKKYKISEQQNCNNDKSICYLSCKTPVKKYAIEKNILENISESGIGNFRNDIIKIYEQNQQNKPLLSDSLRVGFDSKKNKNIYSFPNKRFFYSNILSEMVTTHDVYFEFEGGIEYFCTKDDENFDYISGDAITEHGSYRMFIYSPHNNENGTEFKDFITVFTFRLIKHKVNNLSIINAPLSCEIINVYSNNKKLSIDNPIFFKIAEEGVYRFEIQDLKTKIIYMDSFIIDDASPHIDLIGLSSENITNKFVTLKNDENDVMITVIKDGEKIFQEKGKYEHTYFDSGNYNIVASDEAGNTSEYSFKVIYRIHFNLYIFIFIVAAIFSIIVGNIIYLKKKIVIR